MRYIFWLLPSTYTISMGLCDQAVDDPKNEAVHITARADCQEARKIRIINS